MKSPPPRSSQQTAKPIRLPWICYGAPIFFALWFAAALPVLAVQETSKPPPVASHTGTLSRAILDQSVLAGRKFFLSNQKPEGNFTYEYDFVNREFSPLDNQVRQAGALWGLVLIHHDSPSAETEKAIRKTVAFFQRNSKETKERAKYPAYPIEATGHTGTAGLLSLALIDFVRAGGPAEMRGQYERELDKYLKFLVLLRLKDGQFAGSYSLENGKGQGLPSPYSDGETLLALVKAAKYTGHTDLKPGILQSAETMFQKHVTEALRTDPDSDTTKAFYQWSSMAFYELYTSGWSGTEQYAKRTIDLAYWMIDVHKVSTRKRNTGYAYEGLILAWELARLTKNQAAMDKLGPVIDAGLRRLTSWQVGGPIPNEFLMQHKTTDPLALGGVMNGSADPVLRIDVTQHQMHAVILARRFIYKSKND